MSDKKPRLCTCKEGESCDADDDLVRCYVCNIQGYELDFPEDSLAPMSTCHGCVDFTNKKFKWMCPSHELTVWLPTYPGMPVTVCQECQDIHNWKTFNDKQFHDIVDGIYREFVDGGYEL